jgi:hypothetical protein
MASAQRIEREREVCRRMGKGRACGDGHVDQCTWQSLGRPFQPEWRAFVETCSRCVATHHLSSSLGASVQTCPDLPPRNRDLVAWLLRALAGTSSLAGWRLRSVTSALYPLPPVPYQTRFNLPSTRISAVLLRYAPCALWGASCLQLYTCAVPGQGSVWRGKARAHSCRRCGRAREDPRVLRFRLPACTSAFQPGEQREALRRTDATIGAVRPRPANGSGQPLSRDHVYCGLRAAWAPAISYCGVSPLFAPARLGSLSARIFLLVHATL